MLAEPYARGGGDRWTLTDYRTLGACIPQPSLDCTPALAEIHDKVDLASR